LTFPYKSPYLIELDPERPIEIDKVVVNTNKISTPTKITLKYFLSLLSFTYRVKFWSINH
jgi:hypothetical protein